MSEIIAPSSISLTKRAEESVDCGTCRWVAIRNPLVWELTVAYPIVAPNRFDDYFEVQVLRPNGSQVAFFRAYPKVTGLQSSVLFLDIREKLRNEVNLDFLFDTGFDQPFDYANFTAQPNQERQISYFVEYKFVQPPSAPPSSWIRLNPLPASSASRDTIVDAAKQIGDKWGNNMLRYYPFAAAGGTGGGGQYVADPNFNSPLGDDWEVVLSQPDVLIQTGTGLVITGDAEGEPIVVGSEQPVSFPCSEATLCIQIEGSDEDNFFLSVFVGGVEVISSIDINGTFCTPITSGGTIEIQVVQQNERTPLNVQVTSLTVICPETQCTHLAEFLTEFVEPVVWQGYPSTISAIHPHELANFVQFRAQPKDINGGNLGALKTYSNVQTNGTVAEFNLFPPTSTSWGSAGYPSGTNYIDLNIRNTSGLPPQPTGNDIFITKRVEFRQCTQRGIYLRWRNKLGGSGYWLFTINQERSNEVRTSDVITRIAYDLKEGLNPLKRLLRRGQRKLVLVEEFVGLNQEAGLWGLTESMRVEMYLPDLAKWLEVNIEDAEFTQRPTRYAHGQFRCVLLLPETFIQEQ